MALYTTILVKKKYGESYEDATKRYEMHAKNLDGLGVPFMIQNMTAAAAENPSNWERYNDNVIDEVIEKYKNIINKRSAWKC